MRVANVGKRAMLITGEQRGIDIAIASGGVFGADIQELYGRWDEFIGWAGQLDTDDQGRGFNSEEIGNPVPRPRQIFAIGLNYAEHADEAQVATPEEPAVFTKFQTSLAGPFEEVHLPQGNVDWEVELVVVVGRGGRFIPEERAWDHVAGVTVGQDLSERRLQMSGPIPQFSLAKSYPGFSPVGPAVVSPDELMDPNDLALGCRVNGEEMQKSRTSLMVFPVPKLIAKLSAVAELLPGDVIFTGTPAGVGAARTPARFLRPGDELISYVDGVGEICQTFVASAVNGRGGPDASAPH